MPNQKYDYRFGGAKKEYSIGVYPKISLKEARIKLIEAKTLLAKGINPNEVKKTQKFNLVKETTQTFRSVAADWFEKNKAKWTAKHAADKWHKLDKDMFPFIGNSPIKTITVPALLASIRLIEGRGSIETAHRVKNIVGEVFAYAIASGFAERNIAMDLSGALSCKPPATHRAAITDPKEVGALMRVIEGYEGSYIAKAALAISPYVMLRPSEVASAEWADIDIVGKIWKIPSGKMKMNRIHIIPLSRQVIEIFEELQPLGGKYVFPSLRAQTRHMNASTVNAALRRMGYIKSVKDIEFALKDLLGDALENMLENELTEHLGHDKYERNDSPNTCNGHRSKKVVSSYGAVEIDVPQDCESDFEPQIVKKRQKDQS